MVLADLEVTIVEPVAMFEWRCRGLRRGGLCNTLLMLVSVDFYGRVELKCPACRELQVRVA